MSDKYLLRSRVKRKRQQKELDVAQCSKMQNAVNNSMMMMTLAMMLMLKMVMVIMMMMVKMVVMVVVVSHCSKMQNAVNSQEVVDVDNQAINLISSFHP